MNARIKVIYERLLAKEYRLNRSDEVYDFANDFAFNKVDYISRSSQRLAKLVELEKLTLYPEDRFGFYRSLKSIPSLLTDDEWQELRSKYTIFDGAYVGNIASDYETIIRVGFQEKLKEIENEPNDIELLAMKETIKAVLRISQRYQEYALLKGNKELAEALKIVPLKGAESFYQACLFLKILNYSLWLNGNKHITIGRFDQYMLSYFNNDMKNKVINEEEALEIIEELFLSLNFDADLYPGIQQGDNGQSLVVGGVDKEGKDAYNDLSRLVLLASLELNLIDPKINMRVNKNTAQKWYDLGTQLTKKGLGFPQYSNDDIVIPALLKWGYAEKDARDYVVAACWEFIIPGVAMDIPNIDAFNFAKVINDTIHTYLLDSETYEDLFIKVKTNMAKEVKRMVELTNNLYMLPSPLQSVIMQGPISKHLDISLGGVKYYNYGFHGTGLSNAVDALSALKKTVYDNKEILKEDLLKALDNDFVNNEKLRNTLINVCKMGTNDDYVDSIACQLLEIFAKECSSYKNQWGGIYRAGTGSAMYYIWYSQDLPATADGRRAKENLSANYSPSLNCNIPGVLSVIKSFTKPNLINVCNGGPLTLEFHDSLFRNEEGSQKVAMLVQTFVALGGHQLQLNSINRDTLLDAQKNPEKHKNLIVRVWGWSGYFNELDKVYQDHIIKRLEFMR
ncbi:MAG: hypothetical protein LBM99_05900 [Bacillales bacterium]|jgi:formate C-acetyltransferase|nr:hypothetical protein [Bacillales bacterium]